MAALNPDVANRIQQRLSGLRGGYLRQLAARVAELEGLAKALREGADPPVALEVRRVAHDMAGSGTTFGFAELSRRAKALEVCAVSFATPDAPAAPDLPALLRHLQDVIDAARRAETEPPPAPPNQTRPPAAPHRRGPGVFVLDHDPRAAREIAGELQTLGCPARPFGDRAEFLAAVREQRPWAAVVELHDTFLGGALAFGAVAELRRAAGPMLPILLMARDGDMETRVAAARAGADALLVQPLQASDVLATVERVLGRVSVREPRVLVVEDDESLGTLYAATLREAGFLVVLESDPRRVLGHLTEAVPDLVLLDLYMPVYGGGDIAAVIRQLDGFESVPILFLSVEADLAKQLSALARGGDIFLTKPVDPELLVATVTTGVARSRRLQARLALDGLTGAFGQRITDELIEREVWRASEKGEPLTLALVELEGLERASADSSPVASDRLLGRLADVLRTQMRPLDLLGRVGDEQLALLLPDTTATQARRILAAASQRLPADGQETLSRRPTLSAGLAEMAHHGTAEALKEAAWQALYAAKARHGGCIQAPGAPGSDLGGVLLLADPDPFSAELLRTLLSTRNLELVSAAGAAEALALARTQRPAVVFADVFLPDRSGFDLCGDLRDDPATRGIPVVLMTAARMRGLHRQTALAGGAAALMEKPLTAGAAATVLDLLSVATETTPPSTGEP